MRFPVTKYSAILTYENLPTVTTVGLALSDQILKHFNDTSEILELF